MESPIFRNHSWHQRPDLTSYRPASFRGAPVDPIREPRRSAYPVHRTQGMNSGPKVVRIPVHFVGSKPVDRTESAVKIQKVFRGFLIRKCLKKVKGISVQVDEIEEKLWKSETVELLRKEEKEKFRMNETLMSLLFKLDSICGVDFGVRGCRKAVIRKVIALQEMIDAIAAADSGGNGFVETENSNKSDHPTENSGGMEVGGDDAAAEINDVGVSVGTENSANREGSCVEVESGDDIVDVGVDCEVKVSECNVKNQSDGDVKDDVEKGLDDNIRNRELLVRMAEESVKMTAMMSELCERSEMQAKMLNALTQRVEILEKAFLCKRVRRKKNKAKTSAPSM